MKSSEGGGDASNNLAALSRLILKNEVRSVPTGSRGVVAIGLS